MFPLRFSTLIRRSVLGLFILVDLLSSAGHAVYGQSNEGKDFWFVFLEHHDRTNNRKCIITSKYNTTGYIELPLTGWRQDFAVNANSVFIVDVPGQAEMIGSGGIVDRGVHVVTAEPSSVYIHHYFEFRADAALVLPVPSLGNNYYVMNYQGYQTNGVFYPPEFACLATEDNTTVIITYSAAIAGGLKKKGDRDTFVLNKGQAIQIQANSILDDLSGTYIKSDHFIAVFSGNKWTQIPNGFGNRDNLLEQMYPVEVWGKQFIAVPSKTTAADRYRILASEDNTTVTLSGQGSMPGPFTINKGEWKEFELRAKPAYIQASKPIMVAMFLVGGTYNGRSDNLGDPSMVLLNSIEQYRDTVTLYNSPYENITENYINVITTVKDTASFRLDGRSAVQLNQTFQTIGPNNEFAYLQLTVNEGAHVLSTGVCGLIAIAYGYGFAESYAYGGGANFTKFNNLPIPDGSCLHDTIDFKTGLPESRFEVFWDAGDGFRTSMHKFRHTYADIGTYTVKLIYRDLCRNVTDSLTKELQITLRQPLQAYPDTLLCEGGSVTLRAIDRPQSKYKWTGPDNFSSEEASPVLTNVETKQAGTYQVTGYYFGCPTYPKGVNVDIKPNPSVDLGQDTFFCPARTTLMLSIPSYSTIRWEDQSNTVIRTITAGGLYSVRVMDQFGCPGSDSIFIEEKCPLIINIPNVFSPNGDQVNDIFRPSVEYVREFKLEIFSRWGERLFVSNDVATGWNGQLQDGQNALPGVYIYHIFAEGYNEKGDLITEDFAGDVTLLR
ncbi:MAG: gliding motility-associated C-terminal domain-containing protein [Saprospiraceae bacterium]